MKNQEYNRVENIVNMQHPQKSTIEVNESEPGETLETRIAKMMKTGEPITDSVPVIYTERKDGVDPRTNIRTDRFELAQEAMGELRNEAIRTRDEGIKSREQKTPETPEK